MKKVTMQDIADSLGISRLTVWKVFNQQEGVSKALTEQILWKAKKLGYQRTGKNAADENGALKGDISSPVIAVVVSRPDTAVFWLNIIHQIAKELTKLEAVLMYTYLPSVYTPGFTLPAILTNGSVQGFIVLNVYDDPLLEMLALVPLPKVFLDTTDSFDFERLNGDLVLLEGRNTISALTNHLIEKNFLEIGFIGDIAYARTNRERFDGYLEALARNCIPFHEEFSLTKNIGLTTYGEEINGFLDGLPVMPRAFVCASDYVAGFVMHYFNAHGIRVPEDVALTGYDSVGEYFENEGFLTTVEVKTHDLGKRLVHQLLYRLQFPNAPFEIIYVHSELLYRLSTDI